MVFQRRWNIRAFVYKSAFYCVKDGKRSVLKKQVIPKFSVLNYGND